MTATAATTTTTAATTTATTEATAVSCERGHLFTTCGWCRLQTVTKVEKRKRSQNKVSSKTTENVSFRLRKRKTETLMSWTVFRPRFFGSKVGQKNEQPINIS